MALKITSEELDKMIRNNIAKRGLSSDIGEDTLEELKNKIKEAVNQQNSDKQAKVQEPEQVIDISKSPTATPGEIPAVIQSSTEENIKEVELARKEGEISEKEKELEKKSLELNEKEIELNQKEEELSYKPELPKKLTSLDSEKLFIFNENELSLGQESLSYARFRLCDFPDLKKAMKDIWYEDGKTKADVFIAKFEKIGEIVFDPFKGTSNFEERKETDETTNLPEEVKQAEKKAIETQTDITPMFQNVIEPIKVQNINLLQGDSIEKLVEKKIEDILNRKF